MSVLLSRAKRLSPAPVFFLRLRLRLRGGWTEIWDWGICISFARWWCCDYFCPHTFIHICHNSVGMLGIHYRPLNPKSQDWQKESGIGMPDRELGAWRQYQASRISRLRSLRGAQFRSFSNEDTLVKRLWSWITNLAARRWNYNNNEPELQQQQQQRFSLTDSTIPNSLILREIYIFDVWGTRARFNIL